MMGLGKRKGLIRAQGSDGNGFTLGQRRRT